MLAGMHLICSLCMQAYVEMGKQRVTNPCCDTRAYQSKGTVTDLPCYMPTLAECMMQCMGLPQQTSGLR